MKNTWVLILLLVFGLLIGSLIGELLGRWIPFLNVSKSIVWKPSADLDVIKYDFFFQVKLNLASALGLIIAFWIYRRW